MLTRKNFIVFLLLLSFLFFGITASYGQAANELFSATNIALDSYIQKERMDPTVIRSRFVSVNFDRLAGKDIPEGAGSIILNLFDDVSLVAVKDRLEKRSDNSYTWFGSVSGKELSQVVIVYEDGIMAGNITFPGGVYQIRFVGDGVYATREIDQSRFPEEHLPIPVKTPSIKDSASPSAVLDSGDFIDVLVVYTSDAATGAGGTSAMNTLIQLAIDETNQSYANSGIKQRLRLVNRAQVTYTESGVICNDPYGNDDLARLEGTADGYMDIVHTWRNQYGADLVSLLVENGGGYCGCASFMSTVSTSFAPYGFSVVARNCATGYYSFGHELGHNMGAMHDCYMDSGTSPYVYAHGYVYTPGLWRTVMAYNNACSPSYCTRLQYWSNPGVTYGGIPMGTLSGTCQADDHQALNNTAYTVANFRQSIARVRVHSNRFSGSGMSDITVFRPANGTWYTRGASTTSWGTTGDIPVSGDYNFGGTDIAVWRPSDGTWYIKNVGSFPWGTSGDIPVPCSYAGDARTDMAVFRPSTGYWYINAQGATSSVQWGTSGDIPVPGDYNGDGVCEIAVYRPSEGNWYIRGIGTYQWGTTGDVPVQGDYNGNGITDIAVWRPSEGNWYIRGIGTYQWGTSGDIPVPGDYNGGGTDIAVFRPSDGNWYLRGIATYTWGTAGDIPLGE